MKLGEPTHWTEGLGGAAPGRVGAGVTSFLGVVMGEAVGTTGVGVEGAEAVAPDIDGMVNTCPT